MSAPTVTHLLYLHGFRSSPQSTKARQVAARVARAHPQVQFWCPQLPPSPAQALAQVLQGVADWPRARMAVIGSSLGGFYASHVAWRCGCRSAMLNPAVDPARDLQQHIGRHSGWHTPEVSFYFEPCFVQELRDLGVPAAYQANPNAPEYVLIAQGDEVLSWQDMVARYPKAQQRVLPGSDHALHDFSDWLDELFAFLHLETGAGAQGPSA